MATNEKKMTKAVAFEMAIKALETSAIPGKDDAIAKIAKEIEHLAKKSSSGKLTKKQEANLGLAEQVADYMAENPNTLFTVTELVKNVPNMPADMSTQRMTPLLTALVNDGRVSKSKDKGKSIYQYIVPADEAEDEDEE